MAIYMIKDRSRYLGLACSISTSVYSLKFYSINQPSQNDQFQSDFFLRNSVYIYMQTYRQAHTHILKFRIRIYMYGIYLPESGLMNSTFFHLFSGKCHAFISLCIWIKLHCVYVPPFLNPVICWWTSRVIPFLSYYKQCSNKYGMQVSPW